MILVNLEAPTEIVSKLAALVALLATKPFRTATRDLFGDECWGKNAHKLGCKSA